jgi:hypothetical protein
MPIRPFIVSAMLLFAVLAARGAEAQRQGQPPRLAASGRAATALCLNAQCRMTDTSTLAILIEYGQPHGRNREIFGMLVPLDTVWRLGANPATHLVTKVPLTLSGTPIPAGKYTLFMRPAATAALLIVSDSTGMWGTDYPGAAHDRARVAMRSRNLSENMQSLSVTLVPDGTVPNAGVLSIIWGRREFTLDYVADPAGAGRAGGGPR